MRLPILILLICAVIEFLTDWYCLRQLRNSRKLRPLFIAGCVISVGLLVVLLILPRKSEEVSVLASMWCIYGWLSIAVIKILYTLFSLIGRIPQLFRYKRIPLGLWIGCPFGVIIFIAMWWGALFTVNEMEITEVTLDSSRLPESFNNYRIIQFSDAHVGTWGKDTTFVSTLVDSINSLNPDLIVFTGDLVNRMSSEAEPFIPVLKRLHAPDGVLSILGNHDYGDYVSWQSDEKKKRNLAGMYELHSKAGWKLLDNTHTYIRRGNDSIAVIGVGNWGEPPFHVYGSLQDALTAGNDTVLAKGDKRFRILLTHNPEHWKREVTVISDIDVSLSGHTHAMQTAFRFGKKKWSPAAWKYDLWGGLYKAAEDKDAPVLYVNTGCGEVGIPARIGVAYPEITLFILRHSQAPG